MLEFCHKLQPKSQTILKFKCAMQLILSALPEKATNNNTVKDFERQQACVSASGGYFGHKLW